MTDAEREVLHLQQKDEEQQGEIEALKGQVVALEERVLVLEARIKKSADAFSAECQS